MQKSRYIIIFIAFTACVLLLSFPWRLDAEPTSGNGGLSDDPGIPLNMQQLYEGTQGKTPDELEAFFQEVHIEFNKDLFQGQQTVQASVYSQLLQSIDSSLYILELHGLADMYHQYIIVQESEEVLTYKGSILSSGGSDGCHAFRIEEDPVSGTVWVVTEELVERGTGVSRYDEVWYRLSDSSVIKDLQYVTEMHMWMSPSDLVFYRIMGSAVTQNLIDYSARDAQKFHVKVQYHIDFTDSSALSMENVGDAFLFDADRTICYVWEPEQERFTIDPQHSSADQSLFEFSEEGLKKNFEPELRQLEKSKLKVKQDWIRKLNRLDFSKLEGPQIVENLTAIEISNLNDATNAIVTIELPEGFSVNMRVFPKAPNFEYHAEKNKSITTVYSFEIYSDQKDKFMLYGTEGLVGWFYDTNFYRNKPDSSRFPNRSTLKGKVYEGQTLLGQGEIFVLECDIIPKELRTEEYSTFEMIYAWIPIEQEDLAYNLAISVPLGEDSGKYVEMVKAMLKCE